MAHNPARILLASAIIVALTLATAPARAASPDWVTAWSTSQRSLADGKISNATVRMIARVTVPGDRVRIRLDNSFGEVPVSFGHATVAVRARGAALAVGTTKDLAFGGKQSVTIPAGGSVMSDPVALPVAAQQDLAISLFVPDADVRASQHNGALVTSYLTENGAGDQSRAEDGKLFGGTTTSMLWLKAIAVHPTAPASTIVAFGDSITDGNCSTLDAHDRWEDYLALRLALRKPVRFAVINEGIGGNTVTRAGLQPPPNSAAGTERLDRDVLSHAGVSHVILFLGTNDIARGAGAAQIEAGMQDIIARVHKKGLRIIGATILPRHEEPVWNEAKSRVRREVNDWIRKRAGFDSVLDFDRLLRSRADPDRIATAYGCGDGVHPSPYGYFTMAKSIDLGLFRK